MSDFEIVKEDSKTRARAGVLKTPHGEVKTPSYVVVGTDAAVRCVPSEELPQTKTQLIIANTYHLWRTLGKKLETFEGLHERMKWNGPLMTDSGGFQVFSFGFGREHGMGKMGNVLPVRKLSVGTGRASSPADEAALRSRPARPARPDSCWDTKLAGLRELLPDNFLAGRGKNLVRVTDDGVYFSTEDGEQYLDAELSIYIQEKLGADIIVAFDEPTSPLHDHTYTKESLERTHRWATRSLKARARNDQLMYGVVQGGAFEDLRKESAEFIGKQPFEGFAIGGSYGESMGAPREQMLSVLRWSVPYLPKEKPRHLLGIGRIEDVFDAVEHGMDTFDCVIPTREARHGSLWTAKGRFDVRKGSFEGSREPIEEGCGCIACGENNITRGELRELFKSKNMEAGHLASLHNVYFFNNLLERVRDSILEGEFSKFRDRFLSNIHR